MSWADWQDALVFLDGPDIHEFEGWTFEYSRASGPWPLRKDGEPRKRAGKAFYDMFDRWRENANINP